MWRESFNWTKSNRSRRAILVITDTGGDNSSRSTFRATGDMLQEADIALYMVSIGELIPESGRLVDLSLQVGSLYIGTPPTAGQDLPNALARVATAIRNPYLIEYAPPNPPPAGVFHRLRVELIPPSGLPPLTVHPHAGYYARGR